MINLNKVEYQNLNSREKENYNFHKVASALADYGYDSMRLNNDWQGADFIAVKGDEMIKVQLKGRFTVDKKYLGKDIYIAFLEKNIVKIYNHDKVVSILAVFLTIQKVPFVMHLLVVFQKVEMKFYPLLFLALINMIKHIL